MTVMGECGNAEFKNYQILLLTKFKNREKR